jgi:hypothetical protein
MPLGKPSFLALTGAVVAVLVELSSPGGRFGRRCSPSSGRSTSLGDAQARGGAPAEVVRALRGAQAASDRIAHHVDTSVDEDLAPSVPSSAGGFGLGSDSSPRRPMAHPPHLIGGS